MEPMVLLLEAPEANWKLDDETKERGRRNVARAREVLAAARKSALVQHRAERTDTPHAA